jgi:hypothetical protein
MKKITLLLLLAFTSASALTYEEVCKERVLDIEANKNSKSEEYSKAWTSKDNLEAVIKTCNGTLTKEQREYAIAELDSVNAVISKNAKSPLGFN